ncbi:transposase [Desulfococcaceae bacterium HSG9]|nr:transposase [Desulfococcaceae bacterium HSG9]
MDFDDTEDKVHGGRRQSLFNGYYGNHCHMPLHVYEGLSGESITTILKPGKRGDSQEMRSIVKGMVDYLREKQPETSIVFRGDGHFSYPEVMDHIEETDDAKYIVGLTADSRLLKDADATVKRAVKMYKESGNKDRKRCDRKEYKQWKPEQIRGYLCSDVIKLSG